MDRDQQQQHCHTTTAYCVLFPWRASNSSKTASCDYHELTATAAELLHVFFMNNSSSSSISVLQLHGVLLNCQLQQLTATTCECHALTAAEYLHAMH
jgi:hypothetical protein